MQNAHAQAEVDDIIQSIPELGSAIADFNSVPAHLPPYRDVPSIIIRYLSLPVDPSAQEPEWERLLLHFLTPQALRGFENLQDLFVFVVRIVLPNMIIKNRRYMRLFYEQYPESPVRNRLRYDGWSETERGQEDPTSTRYLVPEDTPLSRTATINLLQRPVMRSCPTPDGISFHHWLCTKPSPSRGHGNFAPRQMEHRHSELDAYLTMSEEGIRGMRLRGLLQSTIRVLQIFWWLACNNARFEHYIRAEWAGIAREM